MPLKPLDLNELRLAHGLGLDQIRLRLPDLAGRIEPLLKSTAGDRILSALELPNDVREKIGQIDTSKGSDEVIAQVRRKLGELGVPAEKLVEFDAAAKDLSDRINAIEVPGIDPTIGREIEAAHVKSVGTLAGLNAAKVDALTKVTDSLGTIDETTLEVLVTANTLTEAQAKSVGFAAALYGLSDQNDDLAKGILDTKFTSLGDAKPSSTGDLAKLTASDWTGFFTKNAALLEEGTTADEAAESMAGRLSVLHPGIALSARLPRPEVASTRRHLSAIRVLAERNPVVVGTEPASLDVTGIPEGQANEARTAQSALRSLANSYPGLRLAAVLDDRDTSVASKIETVERRVGFVQAAMQKLGDTPLNALDLSDGGDGIGRLELEALDATDDERSMVLGTVRTYQRLSTLSPDADDMRTLASAGFDSAISIARQHLGEFKGRTGMDDEKARAIWSDARIALADTSLAVGSVIDVFGGVFGKLGTNNWPRGIEIFLRKVPGFQDLFGSVSFCNCEECASIIGENAYFVDLMKFIDENLRTQFAGKPDHPLDLKARRPDLWTLDLTCENSRTRIPTLDIINEILENHIAKRSGFAGDIADRGAVSAAVYEQTLTAQNNSILQPFHLPRARIGAYMDALEAHHLDVADAVAASPAARVQAEFRLSPEERGIIATADANRNRLSRWYGIAFGGNVDAITKVDATLLAQALRLDREELGTLVGTKFVQSAGPVKITAARSDANSVQNDVEWVDGLSASTLDRMHRFSRLVSRTGWSMAELDLVLTALGASDLDEATLQSLAELRGIERCLAVTVADLGALVGSMPQEPSGKSLFDKVFNPPSFVASDGKFPKPAAHFIHPAFRRSSAAPVDPAQPRLLVGIGTDLDGLLTLARHLSPHLAQDASPRFDPEAANDDDRYFILSEPNLSLLYRHARLARLLKLPIEDLFQLLDLLGRDRIANVGDIRDLLDLWKWWKQSGYRLDEVAIATGLPPRDGTRFPDPATVATGVVSLVSAGLPFEDTVFAVAVGTSEQGSRDLVAANPALFEAIPNGSLRLAAGIDLDAEAITVPASATVPTPPAGARPVTDIEVRQALRSYLASEVLVRSLGTTFNAAADKLAVLAALAGVTLTSDVIVRAARGDGPIDPLTALIAALRPFAVALAAPVWDAAAINFLRQNPDRFGDGPLPLTAADSRHPNVPCLTLEQVQAVSTYKRLASRRNGPEPEAPLVDQADIRAVLSGFQAGPPPAFPSGTDAAMSRVFGVPSGLVVGLRGRVLLPPVAAQALERLDAAARLAIELGVDGETMGGLVSDDYATLSRAADALLAAISARFTDETSRAAKLDLAEQPVREAKRDAVAEYLLRSIDPKPWKTVDDLYKHFLIDVDAGGCSTTSRVIAATMSAQLYVHRSILHLEQDGLAPDDPMHVELKMPADAAAEWEWRRNFRVWQANRKVFLNPENYLEPDLRDDKTPLFEILEQDLLQTDINDQNVLDAYTAYLAGFEEISTLKIAGAYHDVSWKYTFHGPFTRPDLGDIGPIKTRFAKAMIRPIGIRTITRDVLHLFGCTTSDPPIYYYRTCENLIVSGRDPNVAPVWSPWRKVGVQITGRRVAPVVHMGRLHVFWSDFNTRPVNKVKDGATEFVGYRHTMSLKFTTLRPDGKWTPPQSVELPGNFGKETKFGPARGQIIDPLRINVTDWRGPVPTFIMGAKYDPERREQSEPIDDYTLSGPNWEGIWPLPWSIGGTTGLEIQYRNFIQRQQVDLFERVTFDLADPNLTDSLSLRSTVLCARLSTGGGTMPLYSGQPKVMKWPNPAYANAVIDERRLNMIDLDVPGVKNELTAGLYTQFVATIPSNTELLAVPGSAEDGILQVGNDVLHLQRSALTDGRYVLRRLGTTLAHDIARRLFEDGVDSLLDIKTQNALAEAGLPIAPSGTMVVNRGNAGKLDFTGPYGTYYRELFFHIPFLIANALNGRGRYDAAQKWYHHVFDPTATEAIDVTGVPPADVAHRLLDRVWRYREFRNLNVDHLRDVLTDPVAIALYRKDPFNPWAIGRRRISALQKAIVMKYVDNLLDWADSLFTQFTMESVNEAMMLYVMAADVLGPRPTKLGDCGTTVGPKTYETIAPLIDANGEVLVELETWTIGWRTKPLPQPTRPPLKFGIDWDAIKEVVKLNPIMIKRPIIKLPDGPGPNVEPGSVVGGGPGPIVADPGPILGGPGPIVVGPGPVFGGPGPVPINPGPFRVDPGTIRAIPRAGGPLVVAREVTAGPAAAGLTATAAADMATAGVFEAVESVNLTGLFETPDKENMFTGLGWGGQRTASWAPAGAAATIRTKDPLGGRTFDNAAKRNFPDWAGRFGWNLIRQFTPVFCVPANTDLLAYWDRVEDRLSKIRHCQDIDGNKRELALLAPPIDPMQLVRMKAAGLSLGDVLGTTSGNLPPYRFLYLVDRAKALAATLGGFGSALLSAMEKRDLEEMNRLRLTQQVNLANLTTKVRQLEIDSATEALESVSRQLEAAEYRKQFYDGLISENRTGWEAGESTLRHIVGGAHAGEALFDGLAAVLAGLPNVGSPFAMTYGGWQLNTSIARGAHALHATANGMAAIATSLAIEGNMDRRSQGWENQKTLADFDIKSLKRQKKAAEIRFDIAVKAKELHEKGIEQVQEILDLADGRFTNHGLYVFLATQLQRIYRGAFQNALALAKLAERAYRFERGEDGSPGLSLNYWDPSRLGLLAGENLLVDLQTMERRFLETNYRHLEVDQAFSLSQIDPAALVALRQTGECSFAVTEPFFSLVYPGFYKQRIKAVRLTIPSITGPYVNVSARLNLTRSWIRPTPQPGAPLVEVPPSRSVSIATSTAQNDAGVFELSFRDERYMPFEGLGAISEWTLSLPKAFRQFDYQTINDVILSISYTAEQDGALRDRVEVQNAELEGSIVNFFSNNPAQRLFSLRQDFSAAFTRLLRSPAGTSVQVEISDRNFPLFAQKRDLQVQRAIILLRTEGDLVPTGVSIKVDGTAINAFPADPTLGNLRGAALPGAFGANLRAVHTVSIEAAGNLGPDAPLPGDPSVVDPSKLEDVLIYVEYVFA